jgi:diguanylate cyclase (GGDEF)-like protein
LFTASFSIVAKALLRAGAAEGVEARTGRSEFEDVLVQGFPTLKFQPSLEARYQQDKESERLRLIWFGGILLIVLTNGLLMADWIMVPDQLQTALVLRGLVQTPLAAIALLCIKYMPPALREWQAFVMGLLTMSISCYLCVISTDPLAPAYLVSLCLLMLFNGGVIRMRFWMSVRSAFGVLALFLVAASLVSNPPLEVLLSMALVIVSSALFALFSSYRSEREERANWLLAQHQKRLHEEVNDSNRELDRLSRFDSLTDLPNRRHLDDFLQQVWSRARHAGDDLALLMIDIDHFKSYNDHYGHMQGDVCIQQVAKRLQSCLGRPSDLIARYGGEEFVAVIPGANLATALVIADRVRSDLDRLRLPHEASPGLKHVTLSIGVASMRANSADASAERLIACADAALYEAKGSGRNAVCGFDARETEGQAPLLRADEPAEVSPATPRPVDALEAMVDLAHANASDPGWSLSFPRPLEAKFHQDSVAERLRYVFVCGVPAFMVFNCFLLTDYLLAGDVFWLAVKVRMIFFAPIAVGLLYFSWSRSDWFQRKPPGMAEVVVVILGVAAAVSLGLIMFASRSPTSQLYHAGLAVIIIYGNLVQRLRFWYAVTFSMIVLAIHAAGLACLPAYNPRLTFPLFALIVASIVFTLMANHSLERDERLRYLLTLRQKFVLRDLEDVSQRLQTLSRVDRLTGLFNRRHFHDHFGQVWQRAQQSGDSVAILILDVDHFKKFNDRYGHQAGDACLAQVAQAMKGALRQPVDMAARLGGEEFIAVLPQTNEVAAKEVAERVRLAVERLRIPHAESSTATVVTVSIGVATWAGQAGQAKTEAELIAAADKGLYQAKVAGRNQVGVRG